MSLRERDLTDHQARTLRHMLGINKPEQRTPKPYRNYAAIQPGSAEFERLAQLGLIERAGGPTDVYPYVFWRCTELGQRIAIESHRRIRYKRGRRLYLAFLTMREYHENLTFRDFLISPEYAQERSNA